MADPTDRIVAALLLDLTVDWPPSHQRQRMRELGLFGGWRQLEGHFNGHPFKFVTKTTGDQGGLFYRTRWVFEVGDYIYSEVVDLDRWTEDDIEAWIKAAALDYLALDP